MKHFFPATPCTRGVMHVHVMYMYKHMYLPVQSTQSGKWVATPAVCTQEQWCTSSSGSGFLQALQSLFLPGQSPHNIIRAIQLWRQNPTAGQTIVSGTEGRPVVRETV